MENFYRSSWRFWDRPLAAYFVFARRAPVGAHSRIWAIASGVHLLLLTILVSLLYAWSGNHKRYATALPARHNSAHGDVCAGIVAMRHR